MGRARRDRGGRRPPELRGTCLVAMLVGGAVAVSARTGGPGGCISIRFGVWGCVLARWMPPQTTRGASRTKSRHGFHKPCFRSNNEIDGQPVLPFQWTAAPAERRLSLCSRAAAESNPPPPLPTYTSPLFPSSPPHMTACVSPSPPAITAPTASSSCIGEAVSRVLARVPRAWWRRLPARRPAGILDRPRPPPLSYPRLPTCPPPPPPRDYRRQSGRQGWPPATPAPCRGPPQTSPRPRRPP